MFKCEKCEAAAGELTVKHREPITLNGIPIVFNDTFEYWMSIYPKKGKTMKEAKFKPGEEVVDMLDKCRLVAESADLGYDVELNVGRWIKYDLENGIPSLAIMRRAPGKATRWFLGTNKSLETVAGECPCGVIIRNSLDDLRGYNLQAVHELVPLDLMEAIYDYFAITQSRDVKQVKIAQQLAERKGGS